MSPPPPTLRGLVVSTSSAAVSVLTLSLLLLLTGVPVATHAKPLLPCQIPFYHKCVVPTYPPDDPADADSSPGTEGRAGRLTCCSAEKRGWPLRALGGAFGFRRQHLRDPLVELAESIYGAVGWG